MSATVRPMEGIEYASTVELTTMTCGDCGGVFAVLEKYRQKCLADHSREWHCPYCAAGWRYVGQTEAEKMRAERDRAEARAQRMRDERDTAERMRRAQKGAKTRIMRKLANGECPCCGKRFSDLHGHMQEKHPQYAEQA